VLPAVAQLLPTQTLSKMKSAMGRSFAVLCVASVGALKVNILSESNSSEEMNISEEVFFETVYEAGIPVSERKTFVALPGNGWCVDASGKESTARTKSLRMSCSQAQRMCVRDDMCVAFACVENLQMAVLYTSTNCVFGCDVMKWLIHPDAIAKSGYDSHVVEMAPWKAGSCFVDERARHGSLINEKTDTTNCDFETDTCGWTIKGPFKWKKSSHTSAEMATGPRAAESGTGFLIASASSALFQGKTFEVISPFLGEGTVTGKQSLMSFWYSMDGALMGDLEFWCDTKDGRRKLWSKEGNQGAGWKKATVEVPATQCRFKAITAKSSSTDIGLDDITFEQKLADISCNFDEGLCDNWEVATTGWLRNKGTSDTGDTGPTSGAGGADSSYMYLEASGMGMAQPFELNSREFLLDADTDLKFKYSMHGANMGTLKLDVVTADGTVQKKWEMIGQQNADSAVWLEATVSIPAGAKQLKFTGITGTGGDKSDMAIDDVEFVIVPKY